MALEHRCDHYYHYNDNDTSRNNNNDNNDDDSMMSSKMDDVSSVLAQQAESSLSITNLETREVTKTNPFAFAMPRQVHPGLYSSSYNSPTTAKALPATASSSLSTTAAAKMQTPASTPVKGVPGFPDFPWTGDFVVPGPSSSSHLSLSSGQISGGPSAMVSSPQNNNSCNNCSSISSSTMTMKSSIFGHFVDEALTATPIRSNIAAVGSGNSLTTVKPIPASTSSSSTGATTTTTSSSDNNFEYNAMLLDLHRDNTKRAHKHNLRRLKKLRRQRVNHGSLKAASIIQSMPKPRQASTIASSSPNEEAEEVRSKKIHVDEQHQQQEQDGDQDMSGGFSSIAAASTPMTRWHHHHHHRHPGRRDDDTGCKVVVAVKKKKTKQRRASNKLWTKMQNRRTKQRAVKSFYVQEWKRNGPLLRPEEPSRSVGGNCKSEDDPIKMAAMKKEKKRIKKKLKRDVVELSFDLKSLQV